MDDEIARGLEVVRSARSVGVEAWLDAAAEEFCFRGAGKPHHTKATEDDYLACALPPDHEGDCIFGNAAMFEDELKKRRGIRK